ncbi:Gfo/Idh/MocA family oxidoreductase [Nocardiopsis sp. L17-MgMaSL7]|uniref:Gfo/Idh/MocA family oxidoreductase n=1 Tax=Nocardiopsis sp. L17-MgMaSL7 TaxID=1938893 RepID=UPI000D71366A|nr:Gfo/Idh/MocA family oxidoreductase [Nocardiopsis sp. L17-MgMaSL7]PWV55399.1 thiazolinyl imide reductase [Nocardiopsis sp. L17-MgMaSL7]
MSASAPLRAVVCGTNFGRFYIDAVQRHPGFTLAGILSTGSRYSRELAEGHGVPCHTSPEELPDDIDAAFVAVPAAVMGGRGSELTCTLLDRGVHVLQEHPMHPDELSESLRRARRANRQFHVNTHYPHVAPVREFIEAATRLRERQRVLFVDAAAPVHVLAPLIDILARALGGTRPWRLGDPAPLPEDVVAAANGEAPLRLLHGAIAGAPLTLRVQNQIHPGDRDNHSLFWHRVAVGTEGGVLTLADTHGPVLWHPRMHSPRDSGHRLVFTPEPGAEALRLPASAILGQAGPPPRICDIFSELWPAAIGEALDKFAAAIAAGADPLRSAQHDLAVFALWRDLMARLGPPELIRPADPEPLAPSALTSGAAPTEQAAGPRVGSPRSGPVLPGEPTRPPAAQLSDYNEAAEFFDLGAREHTARTGPAVVACLNGIDPQAGPLVDIGAGSGLVTRQVASAYPDSHLIATEPAAGMRALLTARVGDDPELARRVTVLPHTAEELLEPGALPERISGAVLCGVLGHLEPDLRHELLRELVRRLAPGAPIVVELTGMREPTTIPPTLLRHSELGDQRYEWWMAGEPDGPDRMRLDTTWRVFRKGGPVREVREQYRWYTLELEQLAKESGLHLTPAPAPHAASVPYLGTLAASGNGVVTT